MSGKNYILSILFIAFTFFGISQEAVLCSLQKDSFKIENSVNIPIVTSNGDDTVSLAFPDQNVTDVFGDYTIYDFFQTFPNSSETLQKYYTITFDTKSLIENVISSVPINIIKWAGSEAAVYNSPIRTTIKPEIILALDGKTFEVTKYISTSDECDPFNNNPSCYLIDVPSDFNFLVNFNYDTETELLRIESEELTSCGNAFSIDLAGGNTYEYNEIDNILQLWESISETSAITESSEPCHSAEAIIFSILDIACPPYDNNSGNFYVTVDSETGSIQFIRELAILGYNIIELSEVNLSIEEESFQHINPFQIEGNPYLQISNLNNQSINMEIYNVSGQQIIQSAAFEENSVDISNYTTGLYFIKLSNLNNQQKIFKFLKK